jgi:hypothetical protein
MLLAVLYHFVPYLVPLRCLGAWAAMDPETGDGSGKRNVVMDAGLLEKGRPRLCFF